MPELTADQRAELTRLHTRRGVSGAIPTHLDCSKVNAALDAAETKAARDAKNSQYVIKEWQTIAGQVKRKATEQRATLALADALAAAVLRGREPHPFKATTSETHGCWSMQPLGPNGEDAFCNLLAADAVHGEPLRLFLAARK